MSHQVTKKQQHLYQLITFKNFLLFRFISCYLFLIVYLCTVKFKGIKYILTDIEGTTSSVKFVYDILFPYFRNHISEVKDLTQNSEVQQAIKKTVELAESLENKKIRSIDEVLDTLLRWSMEDRKVTPLKTLQGILWEKGYKNGEIQGHVYPDVAPALRKWKEQDLELGVFSSGSVSAQKLIFGYSEVGDLKPFFSNYFDTTTGGKRETETYTSICGILDLKPEEILFLSDISEELEAAQAAGLQTVQLTRPGTEPAWNRTVIDFSEIEINDPK